MREFIIPLAVGISMFLFGMHLMRIGLKLLAEERMKKVLTSFTKTPYHGFLTGTLSTMCLQSSSAVTVLTIGFTNAEIITFSQSMGIIIGSNVGTTFTTEAIALNLGHFAPSVLLLGTFLWLFPIRFIRYAGLTLGGFACIFLGLDTIKQIAVSLEESRLLEIVVNQMQENYFLGILLGLVITAIIQSSTATAAIVMGFVTSQMIPITTAVTIILGSNIGTCFTAFIASIGANKASKQVAGAHILFNLFGVLLFLPFIGGLTWLSGQLSRDPGAQIAHAHMLFNLISAGLVLPFSLAFTQLIKKLIPEDITIK